MTVLDGVDFTFSAARCVRVAESLHFPLEGTKVPSVLPWSSMVMVLVGLVVGALFWDCTSSELGGCGLGRTTPSDTYPCEGSGLVVDAGVGIRLGLACGLTPVPEHINCIHHGILLVG